MVLSGHMVTLSLPPALDHPFWEGWQHLVCLDGTFWLDYPLRKRCLIFPSESAWLASAGYPVFTPSWQMLLKIRVLSIPAATWFSLARYLLVVKKGGHNRSLTDIVASDLWKLFAWCHGFSGRIGSLLLSVFLPAGSQNASLPGFV